MTATRPGLPTAASWAELALGAGGRSLIEASAGTGKTWTISVLYLRLLLEQQLGPRQIIVTTFTDAAAAELRERIRARITWALSRADAAASASAGALTPPPDGDLDQAWLAARWTAPASGQRGAALADATRLRLALAELDLAPIGTLHSLCRRILTDFPFDCGMGFAASELVDARAVRQGLVDDLWRQLGQGEADLCAEDEALWILGRGMLGTYFDKLLAPGLAVQSLAADLADGVMDGQQARRLRKWIDNTVFTRANSKLLTRLQALAELIEAGDPAVPEVPGLARELGEVLADPLDKHLKAASLGNADNAAILAFAADAARILSQAAFGPLSRALARHQGALQARMRERLAVAGQLTFDELIGRVHAAIAPADGRLADRLFAAWPVALVDEFQDTDALQYGILDRIYRAGDGALRGHLVMIGDPKQAIYRFRGGDIHAYLAAREDATERLTLGVNHRSARALVDALNGLYARAGDALSTASDQIRHVPVVARGRDEAPYTLDGKPCANPLAIHYWPDPPAAADARRDAALVACASHIVALLCAGHAIGGQPLAPGNIAVLVPAHRDIARLRAELQARKVPCVSSSKAGVFDSLWARELQLMLYAVLNHRDEGAVRAALATTLGGLGYAELRALAADPAGWPAHARLFAELDGLWRERGVLALVQRLNERARARLFARPDSERALTDLRHLGELLQAESDALPGREQLLAWLDQQRAGSGAGGEAADQQQLRIESDAARVTLTTLHASKGLEFDVVLLPLMWANAASVNDHLAIIHANGQRTLAFGPQARAIHAQDGQDERFRLLYVALTRARHACHVYALPPGRGQNGRSSKPLGGAARAPLDVMLEKLAAAGGTAGLAGIDWIEGAWSWPPGVWRVPSAMRPAERRVREEPPAAPFIGHYSFSALARGPRLAAVEERAASDEGDPPDAQGSLVHALTEEEMDADGAVHAGLAALAPLAGIEFGHAVHAMFERRALDRPMSEQLDLIRDCLGQEGVHLGELDPDTVCQRLAGRLEATLATPLLESDDALRLGALPGHAQMAEMGFSFVLDEVSMAALRRSCDFVPDGAVQTLRGFMNGKIDLVFEHAGRFHVLDYKTNRLGDGRHLGAYAPARLEQAMDAHHYRFQALIYNLAVDRYLRQRLPGYRRERHLGETLYLFVRASGIEPVRAPRAGIWAHRFDDALLEAADRIFAGGTGSQEVA